MIGHGSHVTKPKGYPFPGIVVATFMTTTGAYRVVVESTTLPGMLHIFSPEQLEEDMTQIDPNSPSRV